MIKKYFHFTAIVISLLSCQSEQDRNIAHVNAVIAEVDSATAKLKIERMSDSIMHSATSRVWMDTVGTSDGPVLILERKFVIKEYSNYKDVFLRYKNVSGKKIEAIKFRWYGTDAFGDPADMGITSEPGFGGGFTDDALSAGKSSNGKWSVMSMDGKKIVNAWAYEVVFSDGTKWKSDFVH